MNFSYKNKVLPSEKKHALSCFSCTKKLQNKAKKLKVFENRYISFF